VAGTAAEAATDVRSDATAYGVRFGIADDTKAVSRHRSARHMIETLRDLPALRERIGAWKRDGLRIGFVPTMGNLHAGHHSLVTLARAHADRVVASVFVNPTQFGPNEDFGRYPRTPDADAAGLDGAGCDLLWLPSVDAMYPFGADRAVRVRVPGITDVLDGAHRPGHFDGVCTVVARLFNQVQPDAAAFGRKDYQQLAVIRYLVRDLAFPIELLPGEIVRESDGLAMSSRNQYLSAEERATAPAIHRVLQAMAAAARAGRALPDVEADAAARLADAGFAVDYAVVRRADLAEARPDEAGALVALIAARLGRTRLIDNLEFAR
jgi:pantoate--beta-alanine ligase